MEVDLPVKMIQFWRNLEYHCLFTLIQCCPRVAKVVPKLKHFCEIESSLREIETKVPLESIQVWPILVPN